MESQTTDESYQVIPDMDMIPADFDMDMIPADLDMDMIPADLDVDMFILMDGD